MPRHPTRISATNRRRQRAAAAQLRADVARKAADALARRYGHEGASPTAAAAPARAA